MKKIFFLAILFASCSNDSKIQYVHVEPSGWMLSADSTHNVQTYDTLYTVGPNASEKIGMEKARGDLWLFFIGVILLIASIIVFIIRQNRADDGISAVIPTMILILALGSMIGSSIEWVGSNSQIDIKKQTYDSLMQKDGNLHALWNTSNR